MQPLEQHVVKVVKMTRIYTAKGCLIRIVGKIIGFEDKTEWFDAWDDIEAKIYTTTKPGDIIIVETKDYKFPTTGDIVKKIYKFKNFTTYYENVISITNENNTRGIFGGYKCFCGKLIENVNKKEVQYFYSPENLVNFIVKGKTCKVKGNIFRDEKESHTMIIVDDIHWIK